METCFEFYIILILCLDCRRTWSVAAAPTPMQRIAAEIVVIVHDGPPQSNGGLIEEGSVQFRCISFKVIIIITAVCNLRCIFKTINQSKQVSKIS